MKKLFTLIAVAAMTLAANAQVQTISFSEAASAGTLNAKTFGTDFVMAVTDTNSKCSIDANTAYFGTSATDKVSFAYRFKTGGKSSSNNKLTFTIPSAGKMYIYVRSGSNSEANRTFVVSQNSSALLTQVVKENATSDYVSEEYQEGGETKTRKIFPIYSVDVAQGTVEVTYPDNGMYFYGFSLGGPVTAINEVSASAAKANNGVVKTANYIIKGGKKYNYAGQQMK